MILLLLPVALLALGVRFSIIEAVKSRGRGILLVELLMLTITCLVVAGILFFN